MGGVAGDGTAYLCVEVDCASGDRMARFPGFDGFRAPVPDCANTQHDPPNTIIRDKMRDFIIRTYEITFVIGSIKIV